jgi:hypothetical protein
LFSEKVIRLPEFFDHLDDGVVVRVIFGHKDQTTEGVPLAMGLVVR